MTETGAETRIALGRTVLVIAALSVLTARSLAYDFVSDDAFISLRYVDNLATGNGLVFNSGDRVEGYSNPLWVLVLAGMVALTGVDSLLAARALGGLFALALPLLVIRMARREGAGRGDGPARPWVTEAPVVLGCLLVASSPPLACWSLAGLETASHAFLVLVAAWAVLGEGSTPGRLAIWRTAVVCGLVALSRPEGLLIGGGLVFLAWLFEKGRTIKGGVARAGIFLALPGAYFLFRVLYFGQILPNTYHAKAGGGLLRLEQGAQYLGAFLLDLGGKGALPLPLALPLALIVPTALLLGLAGKLGKTGIVLGIVVLLQIVFVVASGGDGLPMYRFLVPVVAPLALLAGLLLRRVLLLGTPGDRLLAPHWIAIVLSATLLVCSSSHPALRSQYSLYRDQKDIQVPAWTAAGLWLKHNAPAGASLAAVPVGAISYYSGLTVIDMLGLTDHHIAHSDPPEWRKKLSSTQRWAGHEKQDGAYILSRRPTYLLLGNIAVTDEPLDTSVPASKFIPYPLTSWIRVWEWDVIHHPDLDRLYAPRVVRLENGRYFNFLERREGGS